MAQLKAQETQHDPAARYTAKFYRARRLYERGYCRDKIINLFHVIDWIMQLPHQLETKFGQELQSYEEATYMRYVTSIERSGMEKGLQQGALRQLHRDFIRHCLQRAIDDRVRHASTRTD